jgi:hypothetical protein
MWVIFTVACKSGISCEASLHVSDTTYTTHLWVGVDV